MRPSPTSPPATSAARSPGAYVGLPIVIAMALAVLLAVLSSPAPAAASEGAAQASAQAIMQDVDGNDVGTVSYHEHARGVEVRVELSGLDEPQEFRGLHLHENGVCDPDAPDGPFTSAGGHWAPGGASHGAHAGDLLSVLFTADGSATMTFVTDRFTLQELLDAEVAQMLHGDRDNFAHIPDRYRSEDADEPGPDEQTAATGDAGDRIACGVVQTADADGTDGTDVTPSDDDVPVGGVDAGFGGAATEDARGGLIWATGAGLLTLLLLAGLLARRVRA